MDPRERRRRASSFGAVADTYERCRPGYPADAVAWLFGTAPRLVLDLGAGTGKLTAALLDAGHEVVAAEPDRQMRDAFAAARPGVTILAGTAEEIPLPDRSVDGVAVGQAWHWFDPGRAVPELARVLRRGGTLGIVWNTRDESSPLVAELSTVLDGRGAGTGYRGAEPAESLGPGFSPVESAAFRHVQVLDVASLLGLVSSRSYTITLDAPARAELLAEVEEIGRRESRRSPGGSIRLPYVTACIRATRVD